MDDPLKTNDFIKEILVKKKKEYNWSSCFKRWKIKNWKS